jgi:glutamate:GABA antiporter
VPLAIIRSGVIIAFFYIFATLGMLLALPVSDIGLIKGLTDTFQRMFGSGPYGQAVVVSLSVMALYTFIANMTTWTLGANRSAAEAANRGDLPSIFGKLHATYKTPANAAVLCGAISSAVLLLYGLLASTAEDLFWTMFAFSSVVFLLPYFLLFLSFLKLRTMDAALPRPYKVPGGYPTAVLLSIVCMAFILQAIVFFIYKPGAFDQTYALSVVGGVILTIIVGELLIRSLGAARKPEALNNV